MSVAGLSLGSACSQVVSYLADNLPVTLHRGSDPVTAADGKSLDWVVNALVADVLLDCDSMSVQELQLVYKYPAF